MGLCEELGDDPPTLLSSPAEDRYRKGVDGADKEICGLVTHPELEPGSFLSAQSSEIWAQFIFHISLDVLNPFMRLYIFSLILVSLSIYTIIIFFLGCDSAFIFISVTQCC